MDWEAALKANFDNNLPTESTDFFYKTLVPKDFKGNLEFRRKILELCYADEAVAREVWMICSRDLLFFINVFGWTMATKDYPENPARPFITYEDFQDEAFLEIAAAIGDHDLGLPKSRDMGASWMCLCVMVWMFVFRRDQSFLLASWREEAVDINGDMDTLMEKIWWFLNQLPVFLIPKKVKRTSMLIRSPENNCVFTGTATTDSIGVGGRRTAIFLDEVGRMKNSDTIIADTRDVTNTRLVNSTPNGRTGVGKGFFDFVSNDEQRSIFMHWSDHPLKNKGMYYLEEDGTRVNVEKWNWREHYDRKRLTFTGIKIRSEWYDAQCKKDKNNPRKIAENLDLDFANSGSSFIQYEDIARMMKRNARPPDMWGQLLVDSETLDCSFQGSESLDHSPFLMWTETGEDRRPPRGDYVIGVDIAAGTGGAFSSNSVFVIYNARTGKQVARYSKRGIKPEPFCKIAAAAGKWFYEAMIAPEAMGSVGKSFMDELRRIGYWNVYQRQVEFVATDVYTAKLGVTNSDGGQDMLTKLVNAIENEEITVYDEVIYSELSEYQVDPTGRVYHPGAKVKNSITGDIGKNHGDAAIAAACGLIGMRQLNLSSEPHAEIPPDEMPQDCPAYRYKLREMVVARDSGEDWD